MKMQNIINMLLAVGIMLFACVDNNKDRKLLQDSNLLGLNDSIVKKDSIKPDRKAVEDKVSKFIRTTAADAKNEIEVSKLALIKSENERVKALAETVMNAQTKITLDLQAMADNKQIKLPSATGTARNITLQSMEKMEEDAFNKFYTGLVLNEHKLMLDKFKNAGNFKDAQLRYFIMTSVPLLQKEKDMAGRLKNDLK